MATPVGLARNPRKFSRKTGLASILENRIGSRRCVTQILRVHARSSRSFCVLRTELLVGAWGLRRQVVIPVRVTQEDGVRADFPLPSHMS